MFPLKSLIILILLTVMMSSVFASEDCLYFKIDGKEARIDEPKAKSFIKVKVGDVEVNNFYCVSEKDSIHCDGDDDGGRIIFEKGILRVPSLHIGNPDKKMFHHKASHEFKTHVYKKQKCN